MRMRRSRFTLLVTTLLGVTGIGFLSSWESADPWLLGRYSLPDLVFGVLGILLVCYLGFLVHRYRWQALHIVAAMALCAGLLLVVAGVAARMYVASRPGYRVMFLEPDREVGWKQIPDHEWIWTGTHWYAREFSVEIKTNSHGFRDRERILDKPRGVFRVAVLGDSFIEAIQVPMEKAATGLLEQRLNHDPEPAAGHEDRAHEVLNFGIAGYGVGQYLLVWEAYASSFDPDLVLVFAGDLQFDRTVKKYKGETPGIWVRPTFRLQDGVLIREPAADFARYVRRHGRFLKKHGRQSRHRSRSFFATLSEWGPYSRLEQIQEQLVRSSQRRSQSRSPAAAFRVNLRILDELKEAAEDSGAKLAVIDAFRYFAKKPGAGGRSEQLKSFCAEQSIGYFSVSDRLLRADEDGVTTRWPYDRHFTEAGNRILAEAMYDFMTR